MKSISVNRQGKMDRYDIIDWVYSQLEDEESKFIYKNRELFNRDGNYKWIGEIIDKYVPQFSENKWYPGKDMKLFQDIKERGKNVVIFGAGVRGMRILDICARQNIVVDYLCDSNSAVINGNGDNDITIISPDYLEENKIYKDHSIIISPMYGYNEILSRLLQMNCSMSDIYIYAKYAQIGLENQYFDEKVIRLEDNEVFVDGGCYDFSTGRVFIEKMQKLGLNYKKIYAFEPDEINYNKCERKIKESGTKKVDLVAAGLWSLDTYVQFLTSGNGSSRIVSANQACDGFVKVISLDSYIEEGVSFIKMDIEGAEMEALKGARNTILRNKPKLAICIYHKKEDLWEIPYFIKKLVPEYRIYIRHYSNCETETVLYAV